MSAIFSLDIYYLAIFFLAVYAASLGVPTGAMLIIVSFSSVAESGGDIALIISLALLATTIGDYSAFLLAKIFRKRFEILTENISWIRRKRAAVEKTFRLYGVYTVFLSRFLFSGIGPYINYFSGLQGLSERLFLRAVVLGEFIYCILLFSIGYFFSDTWQSIIKLVRDYTVFVFLAIFGLFIFFRLLKMIIKNKHV